MIAGKLVGWFWWKASVNKFFWIVFEPAEG
jgi:hypothetical protein